MMKYRICENLNKKFKIQKKQFRLRLFPYWEDYTFWISTEMEEGPWKGTVLSSTRNSFDSHEEAEKKIIGVDHTELGGMIAKMWKFSPKMVKIIRHHLR